MLRGCGCLLAGRPLNHPVVGRHWLEWLWRIVLRARKLGPVWGAVNLVVGSSRAGVVGRRPARVHPPWHMNLLNLRAHWLGHNHRHVPGHWPLRNSTVCLWLGRRFALCLIQSLFHKPCEHGSRDLSDRHCKTFIGKLYYACHYPESAQPQYL